SYPQEQGVLQAALTDLRASGESRRAGLADLDRQVDELTRQHETAAAALSEKRARWEVLRQFFGAPDGRATLGQVLEVDPRDAPAIEAALNHNLRVILADDLAAARAWLGNDQRTIPVTAPELLAPPSAGTGLAEIPPQAVAAVSVVRATDARFDPLLQALLRDVVIVDTLDQALAVRAAQPGWSIATRTGECVGAHGILSAVAGSHIAELGTLAAEVAERERQVTELAGRKDALAEARTARRAEVEQLRADLHAREIEGASREGEQRMLATEQRDLDSKIHTVLFELNSIEQQDTEQKQRRAELVAALQQAETRETELRDQIAASQQAVDDLHRGREEQTRLLTELRVSVGGVQHQRAAIESQREPISGRIADLQERARTCREETVTHTNRITQLQTEIAESEQKMTEIAGTRAEVQQQLAGFQQQRAAIATGIGQAETELKSLRGEAATNQEQKSALDLNLAQKRMELQNLQDRIRQRYQVDLDQVRSESLTITVADQGPAVTEQVPVATDWEALEAQVAELQTRLDAMGPVNVEAIQEFDELEERYQFLTQQHDDLVKAKEQLLQVISKINATTKQLFSETFDQVRANFQTMFTELFGGGKANLLLLDENDVLESGIEIVAKPPGKQLQSISLLSGGERTLTATALLFSIYMVKPSPFCVLDELDAPLDESNINRFIRILQRFIEQSQFVIITHNKRTIGMADALYGITMEEHGVSKVVSVKFSPREETTRKATEHARERQEDRIDGSATAAPGLAVAKTDDYGVRPHEEELRNDLLVDRESTVAPVADAAPVSGPKPVIGQAPPSIAEEVQAAVTSAVAATQSVQQAVPEVAPPPKAPRAAKKPDAVPAATPLVPDQSAGGEPPANAPA
ncbi:hypothetical protein HQ590_15790, partial [bacterium]|nr:hypothetical protein [bacterium]